MSLWLCIFRVFLSVSRNLSDRAKIYDSISVSIIRNTTSIDAIFENENIVWAKRNKILLTIQYTYCIHLKQTNAVSTSNHNRIITDYLFCLLCIEIHQPHQNDPNVVSWCTLWLCIKLHEIYRIIVQIVVTCSRITSFFVWNLSVFFSKIRCCYFFFFLVNVHFSSIACNTATQRQQHRPF